MSNRAAGNTRNSSSSLSHPSRSLTILQLKQGVNAMSDVAAGKIIVDGQEANKFTIIGEIMSLQRQTASTSYLIYDGTGEIIVKKYIGSQRPASAPPSGEEIFAPRVWVVVHGFYCLFGQDGHVHALSIRAITDYNELAFHFSQSIRQHLFLTQGPLSSSTAQNASGSANQPAASHGFLPATTEHQVRGLPSVGGDVLVPSPQPPAPRLAAQPLSAGEIERIRYQELGLYGTAGDRLLYPDEPCCPRTSETYHSIMPRSGEEPALEQRELEDGQACSGGGGHHASGACDHRADIQILALSYCRQRTR